MQTSAIDKQEFLHSIKPLIWWVKEEDLGQLNDEAIVEAVLNYGNLQETRQLFDLLGTEQVAHIFKQKAFIPRTNYYPKVRNYFDLYFKRHVPTYTQQ